MRTTLNYCAPELLVEGKYSKKSDIWAVGCIFYEVCFVTHSRQKAFTTMPAITSYYYNESTLPPQISWDSFEVTGEMIPEHYKEQRKVVEKRFDRLNILFAAIFRRKPEERPSATELKKTLELISKGEDPTIIDYRPGRRVTDE